MELLLSRVVQALLQLHRLEGTASGPAESHGLCSNISSVNRSSPER